MRYYAILYPGETVKDCWRVCRSCTAGFEKYNFANKTWEFDASLFLIHAGEPEVEEITEAQASEIIECIENNCLKARLDV